jgi:rhodanese-related sulfurtransferase
MVQNLVRFLGFSLLVWLSTTVLAWAADKEFPGRDIYTDVSVIALQDLKKRLADVVVIDVRSEYEYQTLRIKDARNIPLASKDFVEQMGKLRVETDKDIIVYCNGKTCMKSYKAARKCNLHKIPNVYAYDAGIMDWAKAYPNDAVLLGKVLGNPKKLISKEMFQKHLLEPDAFGEKVSAGDAIVLDVRDRFQRDALAIFPGRERRAYLDQTKKLNRYISKAKRERRPLLIYDAAGKQVRWFQYYLEEHGVRDYYFMKGGSHAYFKGLTNDFLGK